MKIVCLGNTAQDTIDAASASYARTSAFSNTAVNAASKSEPGFFEKAWGIFEKLGTIASPTPAHVVVSAPAPSPLPIAIGVGVAALLLYKVAKG